MKRNDTDGAREFAGDAKHSINEVDANWWSFFSGYRLKQWKAELRRRVEESGKSVREICDYAGLKYSDDASFFLRLPKKRNSFIGIGMALGLPLHTIDRWISKYGMKRKLYAKDVAEDLVWIYLIEANAKDPGGSTNYYRLFDQCADAVYRTYCALWQDYIEHDQATAQVQKELEEVPFDPAFENLTAFVAEHMDALKTAFAKPRNMLADYTRMLLKYEGGGDDAGQAAAVTSLRGYLDDAMINYLSGDPDTIHARERRSGRHTLSFKKIPKGRKSHISLALALGMTRQELDRYLELMGFSCLDAVRQEEGILISALEKWEREHPTQRQLKKRDLEGDKEIELTDEEARSAARELLHMRQDIGVVYARMKKPCPYLK